MSNFTEPSGAAMTTAVKKIDLGLQGGGAHGAFTWGVLDRLLSEERIQIEGISGTSAGAMNAVVVADGLAQGGREGARDALKRFWRAVSEAGKTSPIQRTWVDQMLGRWSLDYSPGYIAMDLMSRLVSPYEMNPLNLNPLRDLVASLVDFDRVNHCKSVKLFISATNVRTGRPHVFKSPDITVDTVMASACLPFVFQAVEIDGEAYWDGGFMGNPVLYPLIDETTARDLVIVQINPLIREGVPRTARDILNRINEIDFNSSLLKDIRAILMLKMLGAAPEHQDERLRDLAIHRIHAEHDLADLGVSSKMNAEWAFLEHLHDIGRRAAERWISEHWEDLGVRSTYPLDHVLWGLDPVMRGAARAAAFPFEAKGDAP
ncbi:patatin-like phospholipase family protein [Lamprocystis purpurea]|uniref:patatin-like phospholipase family protein n=1 Tax=Lamprocystis purpurea TaxID=61598 RepID=UPI000377D00B|nr:patatin-like phospholipase family protein [Lamprocystis purpurea]